MAEKEVLVTLENCQNLVGKKVKIIISEDEVSSTEAFSTTTGNESSEKASGSSPEKVEKHNEDLKTEDQKSKEEAGMDFKQNLENVKRPEEPNNDDNSKKEEGGSEKSLEDKKTEQKRSAVKKSKNKLNKIKDVEENANADSAEKPIAGVSIGEVLHLETQEAKNEPSNPKTTTSGTNSDVSIIENLEDNSTDIVGVSKIESVVCSETFIDVEASSKKIEASNFVSDVKVSEHESKLLTEIALETQDLNQKIEVSTEILFDIKANEHQIPTIEKISNEVRVNEPEIATTEKVSNEAKPQDSNLLLNKTEVDSKEFQNISDKKLSSKKDKKGSTKNSKLTEKSQDLQEDNPKEQKSCEGKISIESSLENENSGSIASITSPPHDPDGKKQSTKSQQKIEEGLKEEENSQKVEVSIHSTSEETFEKKADEAEKKSNEINQSEINLSVESSSKETNKKLEDLAPQEVKKMESESPLETSKKITTKTTKEKQKKSSLKKTDDKKTNLKKGILKMDEESVTDAVQEAVTIEEISISGEPPNPDSVEEVTSEPNNEEVAPVEEKPLAQEEGEFPPELDSVDIPELQLAVEDVIEEVPPLAKEEDSPIEELKDEPVVENAVITTENHEELPKESEIVEDPKIEIPIEPIQEPIPVEEEPVSIIVEAPLEANVPEVTVEVAPEVLELNEDLKKEEDSSEKAVIEESDSVESKPPEQTNLIQEAENPDNLKDVFVTEEIITEKEETVLEDSPTTVEGDSQSSTFEPELKLEEPVAEIDCVQAQESLLTLQTPKQDFTPKATKSDSYHQTETNRNINIEKALPLEDDFERGRYRNRAPFHEGDLMSRSAFDEASITPRVKTLEEILASITVTAREVLSYRKKRTCRSMVTEARIRYAF